MSVYAAVITTLSWTAIPPTGAGSRNGGPAGAPSASRHTRTIPSQLPLTATGVPSGSAPTATAVTELVWPVKGSPTGAPSASRHTRTVPSSLPLTTTGVPSGSAPTATPFTPSSLLLVLNGDV